MEYLKCVAQQAKPVVSQAVAPAARDGERDPERERERGECGSRLVKTGV